MSELVIRPMSDILCGFDIGAPVDEGSHVLAVFVVMKVLDSEGDEVFIESTSDNFSYYEKMGVFTQLLHELKTRNDSCGCDHD